MHKRILFAILAATFCVSTSSAWPQLRYGPYIQNTSYDRATIVWYTATITPGILRYGPAPGNWQNEITVATDSAHFVEVTGLAADQRYYYEAATPTTVLATGAEYYFDTHPEVGCTKPFTFAAFGDIGTLEQQQLDVAARLKLNQDQHDFSLLLGDLVYSSGERIDYKPKYFDIYQDLIRHETWWAGLGNHDVRDNNGAAYFEFFVTPANNPYNREHFYSFDYGSAHVVAIDNELQLEEPGRTEQNNWIRADLQDAVNRGQRWLIAYWHEAPYSGGSHSGDGFAKTNFVPIMDEFGVDLVLSGHSHVLERTFPMVNGAAINTHPNQYTKNGHAPGAVYVVSGAGGEEVPLELPGLPMMAFQLGNMAGYAVITIDSDTLLGHFITKTGATLDPFRIIKTGMPPIAKQPVLNSITNITLAEGDTITHWLNATIADTSSPTTMTIIGLPAFANFTDLGNGHGRLDLTPSFYQSGTYANLKLTVENSCASSAKFFSITVNEVTDPPALQAVGNHTMDEAATLTLTLSAIDPNADALTFSINPIPPFATLTPLTSNSAQLSFTPNYRQAGVYPFIISVTDGHARDTEQVTLTVNDLNRPPRIDSLIAEPNPVGDDATSALQIFASDPDEGDSISYAWNANAGTITGSGANVTFVPPIVTDSSIVPIIVEVSDGVGGSEYDTLAVRVYHVNRAPVANAGANQFVTESDTVRLNGSASSDFDAQTLRYRWRQLTGVAVALSDSQAAQPFFLAPKPDQVTAFRFELVVNDSLVDSPPDTVAIDVNALPIIAEGIVAPLNTIGDDTTLTLNANVNDADNDSLTFTWTTLHGALTGAGSSVLFTPPIVAETMQAAVNLNVNDGRGGEANASRIIAVYHVNRVPVANAGNDQSVAESDTVRLNGQASSDFDPQTLSYHWQQLTGTSVALLNAATAQPFFIAPRPDSVFHYLFALTVNDGEANSAPDTVDIFINALPRANAGADQSASEGQSVLLNGNASDDWEGQPLQYRWRQLAGIAVALSDSQAAQPSFMAPRPQNGAFNFLFELAVNDGRDDSVPDTVGILINALPLANAGADQFVTEGDSIALEGSASNDLEGHALAYHWRQLNGVAVALSDSQSAQPRFVAPLPNGEANFAFELVVNDSIIDSRPDTVNVHINTKPRILAGISAAQDTIGDDATLELAVNAIDADNDSLVLNWSTTLGTLIGNGANVTFNPPIVTSPTPALVTLEVNDGRGGIARDSLALVVTHPNRLPIARAGADQFITEADTVFLDGSSSNDFENGVLSFLWRLLTGVVVALSDSQSAQLFFIAPRPDQTASFAFELMVSDSLAQGAPDTVIININSLPIIHSGISAAHDSIGDDSALALSASVSDADGDSLQYDWSATFGAITGTGANVTFTPPVVTQDSMAIIALQVRDGRGGSTSAQRSFFVYHVNRLPLAVAGQDQLVTEGQSVTLNGAGSSDFEQQPLTYHWQQLTGVSATLSDSSAAAPAFIAPHPNGETHFQFELLVHDGIAFSAPDTVTITINRKPLLPNGIVAAHDTISDDMTLALQALATDADNDSLAHQWSATAGTFSGAGANVNFAPAFVTDTITAKIYLRVSDGKGGSVSDSTQVVIYHGNDAPVARAGVDQFVTEGDTVKLNGAQSGDPEQQSLSYLWQQIHGAPVALSDSHAVAPTFIAPRATPDTALRFALIVNDGYDASAPDTTQINVNNLPIITSLSAAQDSVADEDTLAVSASVSDVDGDSLTLFWTTNLGFLNSNGASALFLPPPTKNPLMAMIKLRVVDEHGGETQDSLALKVYHRNEQPVANAGADQSVAEGDLVTLEGRGSNDPEQDPLSYHWRQIAGPAIVFMNADSAQPSFYAAGVTTQTRVDIELIVNDSELASTPDTVAIMIAAIPETLGETTFAVAADALVRQSKPAKNYGAETALEVELNPPRRSYLRFKVSGILGPIHSAKLKLRAGDDAPSGGEVHAVSDTLWSETGINYNNAPPYAAAILAQFGSMIDNTDYEVEVTPGMNDNRAVSFALISNHAEPAQFFSRESANPPQLWVKHGQSSNLAPKILSGPIANPNPVSDNATANVSMHALDLDGDPLQYTWTTTFGTLSGSGASVTFTPANVARDTSATISAQIADGKGGVITGQTTLAVLFVNDPPLADAGVDQAVDYAETVTLNGAASYDPEGKPLTFAWQQIAGPGVTLSNASSATPAFVAPTLAGAATLSFQLLATDEAFASAPDTVHVAVDDRTVTLNFTASLDGYVNDAFPNTNYGSDSTLVAAGDPQRRAVYLRFEVSGVAGEMRAATLQLCARANGALGGALNLISNSSWTETGLLAKNAPTVDGPELGSLGRIQKNVCYTFDALNQVWGDGVYNFVLRSDSLARHISREGTQPPRLLIKYLPVANWQTQRPLANAGANQSVTSTSTVTLAGSASSDPQGQALQFYWTQISGVAVALSNLHAVAPTYLAPASAEGTTLAFQLTVSDGKYASTPDTVQVSVAAPIQTATFTATADAYVDSKSPKKNYGTNGSLYAQGTPIRRSYLRFNVTGISTQVQSAIVRVAASVTGPSGGAIHKISNNSWTEAGLTYNNAPPVDGPELSRVGSIVKKQFYEFNVTSAITGPGTYNFALVSNNASETKHTSRESGTPPQLIIKYITNAGSLAKEGEEEGVEEEETLPKAFELYPSYPNPFLVSLLAEPVTLKYALKEPGHVTLRIYNSIGQIVRTLVHEEKTAGLHWMRWNGRDQHGQDTGTGIYIYRIEVQANNGERYVATRKMMRVK